VDARQLVMRLDNVKVVSFSGIDGAGKSTQIDALQSYLRELGLRSTLYTFWDNVVVFPGLREHMSFKAFKGDKGVGSPDKPIVRRDKNVTSGYITAIRMFLYLLDAYSLRVAVSGSYDAGVDVIIFDRYIYDELANLPLNNWLIRLYVRLLLGLIPKPNVAFIVDADPEAAHIRKPEYPLDFVRKNRDSYIALSQVVRGMTVLPPRSVEETTARIKESIYKACLRSDLGTPDFPLQCATVPGQSNSSNA
jgi:thymidylate kinase